MQKVLTLKRQRGKKSRKFCANYFRNKLHTLLSA